MYLGDPLNFHCNVSEKICLEHKEADEFAL